MRLVVGSNTARGHPVTETIPLLERWVCIEVLLVSFFAFMWHLSSNVRTFELVVWLVLRGKIDSLSRCTKRLVFMVVCLCENIISQPSCLCLPHSQRDSQLITRILFLVDV